MRLASLWIVIIFRPSLEPPMYKLKTQPTKVSVTSYLAAIEDETRRRDCKELVKLMKRVTGCSPKMWGPSIVGFDSYHYRYDSGHEGDMCVVGFASRKGEISVYILSGYEDDQTKELLAQLGKYKIAKACLYIKRLADIELPILEKLVTRSVAETRQRYPKVKK
jgi:hypothetical protein